MKKIVLNILLVGLTFGNASLVLAHDGQVHESATSTKATVQTTAKNRFIKMIERYQATIDREKIIMERLNSRIVKIKTNGGNTTAAEKLMADAKTQLDKSTLALEALKVAINNELIEENASTTSKLTRNAITTMKKAGKDIENSLREAHKAMQKTIGVLRGVSEVHNASTTKETNK